MALRDKTRNLLDRTGIQRILGVEQIANGNNPENH